jgi:ceramide glucosyltransferase
MEFMRLLLLLAGAGLIASTGFLFLAVLASSRFVNRGAHKSSGEILPSATLLKPLCGLEPNLESNLTSFFEQDYPSFEIVFGTRDASDPAIDIARTAHVKYPHVPVKFVFSGEPERPNAKVCSLQKMVAEAAFDYLVISDSDVQVSHDYLRHVVRPLLRPEVGLVTCPYRGVPTGGLWSRLEALGMSVEMTSGVIVADLLEGMKFALGPTMAIRRDVLERIGGFDRLADYCADDYLLGECVHRAGKTVVLSDHVIDHLAINLSLRDSILHQVRWMKSTRFSRPVGHVWSVLTFAVPFGILGLIASARLHHPVFGMALFVGAFLNRVILSIACGWRVVRDRRALQFCWLYPVRDLMGFGFWCASFFGREIVWRGEDYRLEADSRMVHARVSGGDAAILLVGGGSVTSRVAVDHYLSRSQRESGRTNTYPVSTMR